ncbi:MAG: hypothetical protein WBQ34_01910 [Candidatus Acidiferrales bacterium]
MKLADFGQLWRQIYLTLEGALAIAGIVGAVLRDPSDRVLLFEFLAFTSLLLGALTLRAFGFFWSGAIVSMLVFLSFTFLAAYFAIRNWRRRRKEAH